MAIHLCRGCRILQPDALHWLNAKVLHSLKLSCAELLCGWRLPWDGLKTAKQKAVKSNVPVYRICLNIERRRAGLGNQF